MIFRTSQKRPTALALITAYVVSALVALGVYGAVAMTITSEVSTYIKPTNMFDVALMNFSGVLWFVCWKYVPQVAGRMYLRIGSLVWLLVTLFVVFLDAVIPALDAELISIAYFGSEIIFIASTFTLVRGYILYRRTVQE